MNFCESEPLREGIVIFHGGIDVIENVNLSLGRTDVDFGKGFYATTIYEQAKRWALRKSFRSTKKGIVNKYELLKFNSNCKILKFDGYDEKWLDFVVANRKSNIITTETHDIIIGNVVDDVINAIDRYIELLEKGRATINTKMALLDELKFSKPNDQICFKTARSLKFLKFICGEFVNE